MISKYFIVIITMTCLLVGCSLYQKRKQLKDSVGVAATDTILSLNGRELYVSWPASSKKVYPVIMAIHGSGREARSYVPNDSKSTDFYVHQRNLAIRNGYMFVVISNGADTWGTDEGIENLLNVYQYISSTYQVEKKWNLWATSAGGVCLARLCKEYPSMIRKAIGTFPVYDLYDSFHRLRSARRAWKTEASFGNINPGLFPEAFVPIPYLIFHGRTDQAVPPRLHSVILQKEVNRRGGNVELRLVDGGHSTDNWNVYDDKKILDFLK